VDGDGGFLRTPFATITIVRDALTFSSSSRIFLIEGILTVLMSIFGFVFVVPFPDQNAWLSWRFLSEREVRYVMATVDRDRGDAATEAFTLRRFLKPAGDPKVWGFALIFVSTTTMVSDCHGFPSQELEIY
jgi:hypothetical protein